MLEAFQEINFLAVLAAVGASFVFGGVWFGVVVAKLYTVALGRESLPAQKPSPLAIIGPAVCNLLAVLTSAILLRWLAIDTLGGALSFGLLIALGYILSTVMTVALNPNFPRPFLYTLINVPYFILSHLLTSAILFSLS